ncbi:hypothetical protein [Inconstantimicrobium mannanitabidum]|uniref:Uncharacterized protein n=1 Tax=Inconstantimicrobium mannanitabidum TaxID=1604901 RepID=A0ACB5R9Z1_9CLOT|nr:hypothetical protein [Clostridium sp. TW13]GKX65856.1 hypothetical protein rsdtw13_11140 [Clostridium sp. TW13]
MKRTKKIVITLGLVFALAIPVTTTLVAIGGGSLPPIITIAFLR